MSKKLAGLFALAAALIAFGCTRGNDGSLSGAILGFAVLGLIYWIVAAIKREVRFLNMLRSLIAIELAVAICMNIDAELQEMSGMLYLIIPAMVFGMIFGGWVCAIVATLLRRRRNQPGTPICAGCGYNLTGNISGRCPECGEDMVAPALATETYPLAPQPQTR